MPPPHIIDLFFSEDKGAGSTAFVEELSDGESSGTDVSKAVTSAMAPLADVVREMEKVADEEKEEKSMSEASEEEEKRPTRKVPPVPTPAKRGRPRKKQA